MAQDLKHIGTPRHSGRYPWGSGKNPQRNKDFLRYVKELKDKGLSDVEIAKGMNIHTTELRKMRTIALSAQKRIDRAQAIRLKEKGLSNPAIGKRMGGINESSVRALLNPASERKAKILDSVSQVLKDRLKESKYIDVGIGIESQLGVARTLLQASVMQLEGEGYHLHTVKYQSGDGKYTKFLVLTDPNVTYKEVLANRHNIKMINDHSEDGGVTFKKIEPINSVSSNRIKVTYVEDGGGDKDGLIELRRGVPDLSLDGKRYAQVRIGVDGTHFMKGMAVYSDNVPDGFDIIYNTKKHVGASKDKIFKTMEVGEDGETDLDNPFGSSIKQRHYIDADGVEKLSAINRIGSGDKISEEGAWSDWRRTISSQVLSKQRPAIAAKQLNLAADLKQEDFDELMSLTNPAVKKILLKDFSEKCDKAAEDLKAAPFPRTGNHVILPFRSIKENEVFAPQYDNGEAVVLIRHPHGGIFEIPELTVNNRNKEALKVLGNKARDAIGINPRTAAKLSGADFDGDTVLVIPNKLGAIRTKPAIDSLINFDPRSSYPLPGDAPKMTSSGKGLKMGDVSNLITDMTIKGAPLPEIVRAVKHSMVVIDAEKHHLDYKLSAQDFNIAELKKRYQGAENAGASTIVSRAKSMEYVDERETHNPLSKKHVNPVTGERVWIPTDNTYVDRGKYVIDPVSGKRNYLTDKYMIKKRQSISTKMQEHTNARDLSSGTEIEEVYVTYANRMKSLANKARLAILKEGNIVYSPSANKTYAKEVAAMNAALNTVLKNKPYERQARLLADTMVSAKKRSNPNMDKKVLKKYKGISIETARARFGAKNISIKISDRDWMAIQAGAITNNKLLQILNSTDTKELKQKALPKSYIGMSPAKKVRAKTMLASGHTSKEVADALGVSPTTLAKALE